MIFHSLDRSRTSAYKSLALVVIALLTSPSNSAEVTLNWTEPTENTDGTPLTDLSSYEIWSGCDQSGVYDTVQVIQAPAVTDVVRDLPGATLCYFAAKSTKTTGVSSEFSNEASKTTDADPLPGQISNLQITSQETDTSEAIVAAGDFVKRRNNANTDEYPDAGSDLLLLWDTAVDNEGSGITYASGIFTLGETGHFLVMASDQSDVDSGVNDTRVNPKMEIHLAGAAVSPVGFSTQYIRRTNGVDHAILQSMAIVEVTTTTGDGDELEIRVERVDAGTVGDVNRVANDRSGVSILKLDDSWNYGRYESSAAFTPSATDNTRNTADLGTTTEEDSPFTRTGNVIDIATNNPVLVVYSFQNDDTDTVTGRSEYQGVIDLAGTEVAGTWTQVYGPRAADGADIAGMCGMFLLEPTSGDDLTLMLVSREDSNEDWFASLQLVELPSSTEAAIVEATTGDFNAIADFAWDTAPRIDTAAFTHTTGQANVDVDNDGDYLAMASQAVISDAGDPTGSRTQAAAQFRVAGVDDESAGHSTYNRASGTADHPAVSIAALLTGLSADDSIVVRNDQLNTGQTGSQTNGSGGMAIIRLSSLFAAGGAIEAVLPIVSDVVADLKAQGELNAVLPVVFDVAAALAAQGELAAVLPAVFDVVADLSSTSALDAALPIEFDVAAELQGQGSPAGVLPIEFDVAGTLEGPADVAGVLPAEFDVAAALGAEGPLDATLPIEFDVLADLKARGGLEAVLEIVFAVAADLKARGQLEAANAIVFDLTANLVDGSGLSATLDLVFDVAADLKAGGDLIAPLDVVFDVAAELRGRGQAESALAMIFNVIADLQIAPSLAAVLPIQFNLGAVLTNATPLVQDKMGDPSIRAAKALRDRPKPRFYAKQWNQFAETFDAFLRRQESLVRTTVLESTSVEDAHQAVTGHDDYLDALAELHDVIQERAAAAELAGMTAAQVEEAIEPDMLELAREIRDEEDILAIIALVASDSRVLH